MATAVHGTLAVGVAFGLTGLSTIIVGLRFYSRYFLVGKLSSPDWMMAFALLCTWSCSIVNYYQVVYLDYTRAFDSKEAYREIVVGGLLTMWIYRINYITDLMFVKLSILLFYNHVASVHKSFHRIVRALMAIVIVSSFAMIMASIFTCNPPSDAWSFTVFWNGFLGIYPTQCYNPIILWYVNAGFNLVTDCVLWFLPIPFFLNLQAMPLRRRLELSGIFSIGIMAVVASAIRLWILVLWTSSWNAEGQHMGNLLIWGQVEQHAGIMAGSIPFLRPIYRKLVGSSHRREQPSPGPRAKLVQQLTPEGNPIPPRTPIIPSPSPTLESSSEPFRAPASPLSPIEPVQTEISVVGRAL